MIALPFALLVMRDKNKDIVPFGPFLILGAMIFIFFENNFVEILSVLGW